MGTIIMIILGIAVLGAVIGFIGSGGKAEGAAAGAAPGAIGSTGCILQLIIAAIPVALGLWLLSLIFG